MSTNARIALYGVANAVLFGAGAITVLSFPGLQEQWKFYLPIVVVASFVLAAPVAWIIAPKLRSRYGKARGPRGSRGGFDGG